MGGWVGPEASLDECGKEKISSPTEVWSTKRPVGTESLNRLSYPCPYVRNDIMILFLSLSYYLQIVDSYLQNFVSLYVFSIQG
jgi:hypothetical protein